MSCPRQYCCGSTKGYQVGSDCASTTSSIIRGVLPHILGISTNTSISPKTNIWQLLGLALYLHVPMSEWTFCLSDSSKLFAWRDRTKCSKCIRPNETTRRVFAEISFEWSYVESNERPYYSDNLSPPRSNHSLRELFATFQNQTDGKKVVLRSKTESSPFIARISKRMAWRR